MEEKNLPKFIHENEDVIKKIYNSENEYLDDILNKCLEKIKDYFEKRGKSYKIGVYLSKDPEIPKREIITILINTEYNTFEEKMSIWSEIEREIESIFIEFKLKTATQRQKEKIEEINYMLSTTVNKTRK